MKVEIAWQAKFEFRGKIRQHDIVIDSGTEAGGHDKGATPKELVLAAICGCTGMDVIGLLKKSKVQINSLTVSAQAETTKDHPRVFKQVQITFDVGGDPTCKAELIKAVNKSQSLYCGVSAMIAKTCKIGYRILLNDEEVHNGEAAFFSSVH